VPFRNRHAGIKAALKSEDAVQSSSRIEAGKPLLRRPALACPNADPDAAVIFMARRMGQKPEKAGDAENHENEVEHDEMSRC
jgi:hypothetical protein